MGTSYSAIPLDDEAASWLESKDLTPPHSRGRPATSDELHAALESLDEFDISVVQTKDGWDAEVSGALADGQIGHTTLWVKLDGVDGQCSYHFHKGWPEIAIHVLHQIASLAGPQLLVPHDTGEPTVVDANSSLRDIMYALHETYR